jgi:ribosomal protein S18 acetylase RimI-like enzyme
MDVTIRPMAVADVARVGEVHVRAWQAAYRGAMPDAFLDGLRPEDRADMWRRGIEEGWPGRRDVIEVDGDVAGFAAYGPERDGDDPTRGELYAINLDPEYWRQGLGRRFIRHVTAELAQLGFQRVVLWVEASNDRARRFYESEGWSYDPGSDRVDTIQEVPVAEVRYVRDL